MGNRFDAEDITQDVFISAFKNLSNFDRTYEKAWLCKITSRKCLDYLKRAGRRSIPTEDTYFQSIPDKTATPEEFYLIADAKQRVYQLCEELKPPYGEIAKEHFCEELSAPEIAEKTGKNLKTVQTQIYRAKAMLKKLLERSD